MRRFRNGVFRSWSAVAVLAALAGPLLISSPAEAWWHRPAWGPAWGPGWHAGWGPGWVHAYGPRWYPGYGRYYGRPLVVAPPLLAPPVVYAPPVIVVR